MKNFGEFLLVVLLVVVGFCITGILAGMTRPAEAPRAALLMDMALVARGR